MSGCPCENKLTTIRKGVKNRGMILVTNQTDEKKEKILEFTKTLMGREIYQERKPEIQKKKNAQKMKRDECITNSEHKSL